MPPLLSEIVNDVLGGQLDLDLIAQFDRSAMLVERLPTLAPDVVLLGLRIGERDEFARFILDLTPAAKVIAISSDFHRAYVYEMRQHRSVLHDFSLAHLLSAIIGSSPRAHN
jgi:DNA-binding NarL/FixJ family response regulator